MKKFIPCLAAFASLIAASAANAHDFFLLPDSFRMTAGPVRIHATFGSSFPKAENTVAADRVERLIAFGAGSPQVRVIGATATALDVEVIGAKPGLLLTAVQTKPRDVDYAEDRIPLILGEYRFRPEAAAAVEKLTRPRNWQVSSRRYAKTLVCVHTCPNHSVSARPTGAALEFVGRNAAFDHFRLLANGQALANYPVDLVGQDGKRQHLVTDARGHVRLGAPSRGTMMLFAAKLEPPAKAERFTLDLTSLTFSRP
jgi:hypothetical protein